MLTLRLVQPNTSNFFGLFYLKSLTPVVRQQFGRKRPDRKVLIW